MDLDETGDQKVRASQQRANQGPAAEPITGEMRPPEPGRESIVVRGARVHNLKNIAADIPRGKLLVCTGVSGSGKSSFAIDTLFVEGQRRFLETLPIDVRYSLPRPAPAAVDRIDHLPPTAAVRQRQDLGRGTVADASGIAPWLRELFARTTHWRCPNCQTPITPSTLEGIVDEILAAASDGAVWLAFPLTTPALAESATTWKARLEELRAEGFTRVAVNEAIRRLDEPADWLPPAGAVLRVVVERLAVAPALTEEARRQLAGRLAEGVETALVRGADVLHWQQAGSWHIRSRRRLCAACRLELPVAEPTHYRLGHPESACPRCLGKRRPAAGENSCPDCQGTGFQNWLLAYRWADQDYCALSAMEVSAVIPSFAALRVPANLQGLQARILARLRYLERVGLDYLTLDRPLDTLSTGEAARIALAGVADGGLAHTLIILDEPTAGLHPSEVPPLVVLLRALLDDSNTLLVIEHDLTVVRAADAILEFGPAAGQEGGEIIFVGAPLQLSEAQTATAEALRRPAPCKLKPRQLDHKLRFTGIHCRNLVAVDLELPIGGLVGIVGVSGSGKSTLLREVVHPALESALAGATFMPRTWERCTGYDRLDRAVLIDDAGIGRTSRGNIATYIKAFDELRELFAGTLDAKLAGLTASHFSFNRPGGRCDRCEGRGVLTIDLAFLADQRLVCPDCEGRRYRPEVLAVKCRGLDISEVLELTVREALGYARGAASLLEKLFRLARVGLDYVRLSQPLAALSGGEAQRLKLATSLTQRGRASAFLCDEPSLGLHPRDVLKLVESFDELIDVGHSFFVVDHDPTLMVRCDWLLELGPGAGSRGGKVIAAGRPEDVARRDTPTGRALRQFRAGLDL